LAANERGDEPRSAPQRRQRPLDRHATPKAVTSRNATRDHQKKELAHAATALIVG